MPLFSYKAINDSGDVVNGTVEGLDIGFAYNDISSSGLHILKIRRSSGLSGLYLKKARGRGIKVTDVIEFAGNLSVMLRAGLPLLTSISDVAGSVENKRFGSRLFEIKRSIEMGAGFSASLALHEDIFPDIFINLVSVGEETGRLEESLSEIALHLQRMEDLKNAIIKALMYPAFALLGTAGALLFWLVYVLPKMSGLFESMGVALPPITKMLMASSSFSQNNWHLFIIMPAVIFGIVKLMSKKESTKYYLDVILLKIPVVKLIVYNKLLAVFSEQLRILLAAGVTMDRSFDIMIKVIGNTVYSRALLKIKEEIVLGSRLSDAIEKYKTLFPTLVFRMVSIGESTGNLPEQLNYLSEYFINKLDDLSAKMGKMIEPIIILVIGGLFMMIILGLLAPIYDLISAVGQ